MLARVLGSVLVIASGVGFYSFTESVAVAAAEAEAAAALALEAERAAARVAAADAVLRDSVFADFDEAYGKLYYGLYQYPNLKRSERRVLRNAPYHSHVSASRHGPGIGGSASRTPKAARPRVLRASARHLRARRGSGLLLDGDHGT